ncbi:fibronectin type III domain-containing protein [Micromonospora sp. KC213]|nr:fibronectin type III domain-containing protein [Micromonospora sp. KC213]
MSCPASRNSIAGYDLLVPAATPTQPVQIRASTGPSTTAVEIAGLRPGTTYTFQVIVRYTDGTPQSAPSSRGTITTALSVPPSAPSDLALTELTPTSATVSWSASTPGDLPIARYHVYVNGGALGVGGPNPDQRTATLTLSPAASTRCTSARLTMRASIPPPPLPCRSPLRQAGPDVKEHRYDP